MKKIESVMWDNNSKKIIITIIILILSFLGREDNFSGAVTKTIKCTWGTDCILNTGDITLIDGNSIKLLRIGSTGAIIVEINSIMETIHINTFKKIQNTDINIENKKTNPELGISTIIITKESAQSSIQTQDGCSNECTAGTKQCTGTTTFRQCVMDYDADPCYEWETFTCPSGQMCQSDTGQCIPSCTDTSWSTCSGCTPTCSSSCTGTQTSNCGTIRSCTIPATTCSSGQLCVQGTCKASCNVRVGDLNSDGIINDIDYHLFTNKYGNTGCSVSNSWCDCTDLNKDGKIDFSDFILFAAQYTPPSTQHIKTCEFGVDCILNVGDIASIEGYKIKLTKIGSNGSIIIEYNGAFITIHAGSLNKIRKSIDNIITIENKKSNYENNIATLVITKILTQEIFEKFKPFREDFYCFSFENMNKAECNNYWKELCIGCSMKNLVCPRYYNPVCGRDGRFYPSACWAEHLGTEVSFYGYCPSLIEFFKALWREEGLEVPSPDIEFTYQGDRMGAKTGVWLRSTLWEDSQNYNILDYNIFAKSGYLNLIRETGYIKLQTFFPVIGTSQKALLVFVMFDNAYPNQVLLDWTPKYKYFMNNYIAKKQKVPNPIQYDLVPVIINPPIGVEKPSTTHIYFSSEEIQKIYNSAISKIKQSDFDILIVSPVFLKGFIGGHYTNWNNMELIEASLVPPEPYSVIDKQNGLDALAAFQQLFGVVISHEILHVIGLPVDHMSMEYGTPFLDIIMPSDPAGQNVNPITGKERIGLKLCDILGSSPDYYAVEIPNNLKIYVNQEPNWLFKTESSSGPCLSGLYNNEILKDYDNDGDYEIMYRNTLIGIELQRSLGWVDIDGDNIAELIDPTAYGGWHFLK